MYAMWRISPDGLGLLEERQDMKRKIGAGRRMLEDVKAQPLNGMPSLKKIDGVVAVPVLLDGMTAREAEVAGLVARGLTNKEIASQLQISPRTIQAHLERTFKKLGIRCRAELVAQVYSAMVRKRNE